MGKRVKLIMMLCILAVFMNIVSLYKVQAELWTRQEVKEELKWAKIDEIQLSVAVSNPYIDSKEENVTFVDVLLGLMKHSNLDIYVTGSNSKMLSSDVLTQF